MLLGILPFLFAVLTYAESVFNRLLLSIVVLVKLREEVRGLTALGAEELIVFLVLTYSLFRRFCHV